MNDYNAISIDERQKEFQDLQRILLEQQEDMMSLCIIIEALRVHDQKSTVQDVQPHKKTLTQIEERQTIRLEHLNHIIFNNRRKLPKEQVLKYSKEVRKTEAGLRTLRLFCDDVVKMTAGNFTGPNRAKERIYYFDQRSQALQVEIHALREEISNQI